MMHTRQGVRDRLPVLVCLSNPRAVVLVNKILTGEGFSLTSVGNLAEFDEASRIGDYSAIVAVDEVIDLIRSVASLPVIDIRSFIQSWPDDGTGRPSCIFDRAGFVSRIRLAAENVSPTSLLAL